MNPWLLWGALLGAVPLVIHFLQRRHWREVDWGAMLFLQAAAKRRQRQSRVESLLLLSVRCLIPILAAVALAQPIVSGIDSTQASRSPRHWVFVVDRTASMRTVVDERSHFDTARDAILRTLEHARPGDSFSLVGLSGTSNSEIVNEPTRDREEFARVVRGLEPTWESSQGSNVLMELPERIRRHGQGKATHVVILSDFPASDWETASSDAGSIHDQIAEITTLADVSLTDIAQRPVDNVSIIGLQVEPMPMHSPSLDAEELSPDRLNQEAEEPQRVAVRILDDGHDDDASPPRPPAILSAHQPAEIVVTLRCQVTARPDASPSERDASTAVQVSIEGTEIYGSSLDLPAGKVVELRVPWTPAHSGAHRVSASLTSDALSADDIRHCVVDVEDRLDVLIIDGAPHVPAARFVELALNPWREASQAATAAEPLFAVNTAGIERLLSGDFTAFDVVVLCDVPTLSKQDVGRLARFVESGGGLIVGLGDAADLEVYARAAFAEGGLCALNVGDVIGDPAELDEPYQVVLNQPQHPVVLRLAAHPQAGLQTSRLHRYVALAIPETSPANAILSLNTGDPLLIESTLGRGRCLIVSSALDDRWGSWVLWPSFVPLMHGMVTYAAAGGLESQSHLVGDVFHRWLPDDSRLTGYELETPNLGTMPVRSGFSDGGMQLETGPLLLPGVYTLTYTPSDGSVEPEHIAVNVAAEESDVTQADLSVIDRISPRVHVHSARSWQSRAAVTTDLTDLESILARRLLAVVLCLLLIEPILARQFRVGVMLLLALSAATVLQFGMMLAR